MIFFWAKQMNSVAATNRLIMPIAIKNPPPCVIDTIPQMATLIQASRSANATKNVRKGLIIISIFNYLMCIQMFLHLTLIISY